MRRFAKKPEEPRRRTRNSNLRRQHTRKPLLEMLEDRRLLATYSWYRPSNLPGDYDDSSNWWQYDSASEQWVNGIGVPSSTDIARFYQDGKTMNVVLSDNVSNEQLLAESGNVNLDLDDRTASFHTVKVTNTMGRHPVPSMPELNVDNGDLIANVLYVGQGSDTWIYRRGRPIVKVLIRGQGKLEIGSRATANIGTLWADDSRLATIDVAGTLNTNTIYLNSIGASLSVSGSGDVYSSGRTSIRGGIDLSSSARFTADSLVFGGVEAGESPASFRISDDASAEIASGILWSPSARSELFMDGGTLRTPGFSFADGAEVDVVWNGGTIEVANGGVDFTSTPLDVPTSGDWTWRFSEGSNAAVADLVVRSDSFSRGHFEVLSGSTLTSDSISVGNNGTLTFGGAGTASTIAGALNLAAEYGEFEILDGAVVTSSGGSIRNSSTVRVSGANAVWTNNGALNIGGAGSTQARLSIGDGGRVDSSGAVTVSEGGYLNLDGGILDTPGVTLNGGGLAGGGVINSTVTVGSNASLSPSAGAGILRTHRVSFQPSSTFHARLRGTTPGSDYSQLDVTGSVSLGDARFHLTTIGYSSDPDDSFVIINNDGTDKIIGQFKDRPEGSLIHIDGIAYQLTYQGGDGNDVELISHGTLPAVLAPNRITLDSSPTIDWTDVVGAATYDLLIQDATTQNTVVNETNIADSTFTVPSDLPQASYTITVTAHDADGGPDQVSKPFTFTILPPITVNTLSDTTDTNLGDGQATDGSGNASLRSAIQETNFLAGDDTIILPAGTYNLTRAGIGEDAASTGDLDITDDLTIVGSGRDVTIIDANDIDRVFDLRDGATLTVTVHGIHVSMELLPELCLELHQDRARSSS